MSAHGHGHGGHGGGGHGHGHRHGESCSEECDHSGDIGNNNHSDNSAVQGEQWSLFECVRMDEVDCLNAEDPSLAKATLKPWHKRLDRSVGVLTSDCDEQLILNIPFTSSVHIRSICVIGGSSSSSPASVKLFVNKTGIDFDTADSMVPAQQLDLVENLQGRIENPLKFTSFQSVSDLTIYFDTNFGADVTDIVYIGLKGVSTRHKREAVIATYEVKPLPKANKAGTGVAGNNYIS